MNKKLLKEFAAIKERLDARCGDKEIIEDVVEEDGGSGSGNWGHRGRLGKHGGSMPGGGRHNRVETMASLQNENGPKEYNSYSKKRDKLWKAHTLESGELTKLTEGSIIKDIDSKESYTVLGKGKFKDANGEIYTSSDLKKKITGEVRIKLDPSSNPNWSAHEERRHKPITQKRRAEAQTFDSIEEAKTALRGHALHTVESMNRTAKKGMSRYYQRYHDEPRKISINGKNYNEDTALNVAKAGHFDKQEQKLTKALKEVNKKIKEGKRRNEYAAKPKDLSDLYEQRKQIEEKLKPIQSLKEEAAALEKSLRNVRFQQDMTLSQSVNYGDVCRWFGIKSYKTKGPSKGKKTTGGKADMVRIRQGRIATRHAFIGASCSADKEPQGKCVVHYFVPKGTEGMVDKEGGAIINANAQIRFQRLERIDGVTHVYVDVVGHREHQYSDKG